MPTAGIIGTGLIGASIGLALRDQGWDTLGWDPDPESLRRAAARQSIGRVADLREAAENADLVVLAGPIEANIENLGLLDTAALVTDVTSVKRPIVDAAPPGLRFVGGHPMAGREHAGPEAASAALFRGAPWVICTEGSDDDIGRLRVIVESMGANPVTMSADDHDRAVATVSHLPHVLAVALTNLVGDDLSVSELVAGSFRDLTRVAASDTGWWPSVLSANSDHVADAIDALIDSLRQFESEAQTGALDRIGQRFASASQARSQMGPALDRVKVVLEDKPGEIAAVGHALEVSHVDVRDLQLRHAEHGGGGILTITVRPEEAAPLRSALADEGFFTE